MVALQVVQAAAAAAARSAEAEREMLQATSSQLQDELRARTAAMEGLVAARDEAARGLAEAKQQLEAEQAAAAAAKAAAAALERRLGELTTQVGWASCQSVHIPLFSTSSRHAELVPPWIALSAGSALLQNKEQCGP